MLFLMFNFAGLCLGGIVLIISRYWRWCFNVSVRLQFSVLCLSHLFLGSAFVANKRIGPTLFLLIAYRPTCCYGSQKLTAAVDFMDGVLTHHVHCRYSADSSNSWPA